MLRDPLWERKRSALFQLGVEQEGSGSKCVAGEGGEGDGEELDWETCSLMEMVRHTFQTVSFY